MRRAAAGLFLAVLAGCALEAPPPASVGNPQAAAAALAGRLPVNVGNFNRGGTTVMDGETPGGQEIADSTANRALAGFVQVVPQPEPMTEAGLPEALQRFVYDSTANTPIHRRLRERLSVSLPEAQPVLRCSELEGTYGRQPVESLACVGVFGGQLVRLRVSHIRREGRMAEVRVFAELVAATLR